MNASISLTANGETVTVPAGTSLRAFIENSGFSMESVVVEWNGKALTRAEAAVVRLSDGDSLEIVRIVAGG